MITLPSLSKLLLLLAILAVVWYGSKWWQAFRIKTQHTKTQDTKTNHDHAPQSYIETIECQQCGKYVVKQDGQSMKMDCNRSDCPI